MVCLEIKTYVFRLFDFFSRISHAPLIRSGYHWKAQKLQKLSIDNAKSKMMTSELEERPRLVTAGYGLTAGTESMG